MFKQLSVYRIHALTLQQTRSHGTDNVMMDYTSKYRGMSHVYLSNVLSLSKQHVYIYITTYIHIHIYTFKYRGMSLVLKEILGPSIS